MYIERENSVLEIIVFQKEWDLSIWLYKRGHVVLKNKIKII